MKYSWTNLPILRWIFTHWDMPYWWFYDPRDWEDYEMHMDLKKHNPIKFRLFMFYCWVDERITRFMDRKNYINNDIPF